MESDSNRAVVRSTQSGVFMFTLNRSWQAVHCSVSSALNATEGSPSSPTFRPNVWNDRFAFEARFLFIISNPFANQTELCRLRANCLLFTESAEFPLGTG